MENFEFDNSFKNKMKGVAAPDYSNQEWGKLIARLDKQEPKDGLVGIKRILLGLGLLLLLSNLFWGFAWYRSQKETKVALTKMLALQNANISIGTSNLSVDTIHKTIIMHHYDTVHHYINYHHSFDNASLSSKVIASNNRPALIHSTDSRAMSGNTALSLMASPDKADVGNESGNNTKGQEENIKGINETTSNTKDQVNVALKSQEIALLPQRLITSLYGSKKPNMDYVATQMPRIHKKRIDFVSLITPKRVSLGASYGLHYLSDELVHENKGKAYGIVASLGITKHLDLTINGLYGRNEFAGEKYDERLGLPALLPPSEMHDFRYFEVEDMGLVSYRLGLGLKYRFSPERKINPFLGLVYTNHWLGAYRIEMEYTHTTTGNRYEEYFEIETQKKPNGFLEPQLGFVYNNSQHWGAELLGYYQKKVSTNTLGVNQNLGLRASLLYKF